MHFLRGRGGALNDVDRSRKRSALRSLPSVTSLTVLSPPAQDATRPREGMLPRPCRNRQRADQSQLAQFGCCQCAINGQHSVHLNLEIVR